MRTYCERCGPGLFDEPLNALSNLTFLFAAWAAWRLGARQRALSPGMWLLIGLSLSIGIGSALWHTFATPWALVLDVVPIMLFQVSFLWLYGRQVAQLRFAVVTALLGGYLGVGLWLWDCRSAWLNGVLIYVPTLVLSWTVGLHYFGSGRRERSVFLISAVGLCLALLCRSVDLVVCRQLPLGTHFLWHVFNGLVVYLAMRGLVMARTESPPRRCTQWRTA